MSRALQGGGRERAVTLLDVFAVGLNFRDVLNVLGMYPGDPGDPGSDFAGLCVSSGDDDEQVEQPTNMARMGCRPHRARPIIMFSSLKVP
eukprot:295303-Prorocentrum_minimum.AAC.2